MRNSRLTPLRRALAAATAGIGILALSVGVTVGVASPAAAAGCADPGRDDINGDGYADVVVTEYGAAQLAGRIHVLYGTVGGLAADATGTAPDDQYLGQGSAGVPSDSEAMDEWGAALALGDFDGDKCADLAIGAPGENGASGAVTILYGGPGGLRVTGAQSLRQGHGDVKGLAEPNDRFGTALAAADFDGDGIADLAIGTPGESLGSAYQAGAVFVVYGSATGLTRGRDGRVLTQSPALGSSSEDDDRFGATLAAADFDGSGPADLAIGVPGEDREAGAVHVLLSDAKGVGSTGRQVTRAHPGVPGDKSPGDAFAAALAAGDLNTDGKADLAVGIPGTGKGTGAVSVLYSVGAAGVTGTDSDLWTQDSPGLPGTAEPGDGFGSALAVGRLNKGGTADLAIGIPADDVGTVLNAGAVQVLMGTPTGLTAAGTRRLHQDQPDVAGDAAPGDRFGLALTAARIMGGQVENLVVGVPAEGKSGTDTQNAGGFQFFGRSSKGPTATHSHLWTLSDERLRGDPAPGAFLGYTFG